MKPYTLKIKTCISSSKCDSESNETFHELKHIVQVHLSAQFHPFMLNTELRGKINFSVAGAILRKKKPDNLVSPDFTKAGHSKNMEKKKSKVGYDNKSQRF